MNLFEKLKNSCRSEWTQYTNHDFGNKLAQGTLNYNGFIKYLQQDYIYLIHYMRCFAMLSYKGRNQKEMNFAIEKLIGIRDVEMGMHKTFTELNINVDDIEEHVNCIAYTRYLLDIAVTGDYLDLLVALAPCFVGYGEMGSNIKDITNYDNNKYSEWIKMYGDDDYIQACEIFTIYLNSYENEITEVKFERLAKIFKEVTKLEIYFFDIAMEV